MRKPTEASKGLRKLFQICAINPKRARRIARCIPKKKLDYGLLCEFAQSHNPRIRDFALDLLYYHFPERIKDFSVDDARLLAKYFSVV